MPRHFCAPHLFAKSFISHTYTPDRRKSFISTHIVNDPRGGGAQFFVKYSVGPWKQGGYGSGPAVLLAADAASLASTRADFTGLENFICALVVLPVIRLQQCS